MRGFQNLAYTCWNEGRLKLAASESVSGGLTRRKTRRGLRIMTALTTLESLDLSDTHAKDLGMQHLARMPRLSSLNLAYSGPSHGSSGLLDNAKICLPAWRYLV